MPLIMSSGAVHDSRHQVFLGQTLSENGWIEDVDNLWGTWQSSTGGTLRTVAGVVNGGGIAAERYSSRCTRSGKSPTCSRLSVLDIVQSRGHLRCHYRALKAVATGRGPSRTVQNGQAVEDSKSVVFEIFRLTMAVLFGLERLSGWWQV